MLIRLGPLLRTTALAVLLAPGGAVAQATPLVAPLDPAYRDLELLVVHGLARGAIHGQRPLSRLTFARAARDARSALEPGTATARRIEARHTADDHIDADLNPLLQRNQGRELADGWTVGGEAAWDARLAPWQAVRVRGHAAAQAQPRVRGHGPEPPDG